MRGVLGVWLRLCGPCANLFKHPADALRSAAPGALADQAKGFDQSTASRQCLKSTFARQRSGVVVKILNVQKNLSADALSRGKRRYRFALECLSVSGQFTLPLVLNLNIEFIFFASSSSDFPQGI